VPILRRSAGRGELLALLRDAAGNVQHATQLLAQLLRSWPEEAGERRELVDCEHRGDRLTHDIIHHLYSHGAAPYDRADVLALASGLDDVVDLSEEVADFLALYRVEAPMEQAIGMADVLSRAGGEIAAALSTLPDLERVRPRLVAVNRLEDDGDAILREALAALFGGGIDPMVVIRWKDIFERLEEAIDSCDRVAHVLEGIVVKHA
jgi:uncharacterized protein